MLVAVSDTNDSTGATERPGASRAAPHDAVAVEHLQRLRYMERLLWGIFLLLVFTAIFFAKVVLMPLVLGFLLALVLSPLVRVLSRLGMPQSISGPALIAALAVLVTAAVFALSVPAANLAGNAGDVIPEVRAKLAGLSEQMAAVQDATDQVEEIAGNNNNRVVIERSGWLTWAVGSVAGTGASIAIAMVFAMFLLATSDEMRVKLVSAYPRLSDKKRALRVMNDIERQISRYLGAITIINMGLGVVVGLAMWLLGMPHPYLWGIGAAFLNYLPYLGAIVGMALSGAIAIIVFDSIGQAVWVPVIYFALTSIEAQMITPALLGRRLSLNPPAVFVTVVFWAWLWGIPGALMAVPFLLLLKVVTDHVPALSVLSDLLSGDVTDRERSRAEGRMPEAD